MVLSLSMCVKLADDRQCRGMLSRPCKGNKRENKWEDKRAHLKVLGGLALGLAVIIKPLAVSDLQLQPNFIQTLKLP